MDSALIVGLVFLGIFFILVAGFGGRSQGLYSGGKKLDKKLGFLALFIMLLGILGLSNLVNSLL